MLERQQIVDTARAWVGTPFRHQGRTREKGVDCIGLVIGVAAELGVQLTAPADYSESPASNLVISYSDQQAIPVPGNGLRPGAVAVLWGWNRNEAQHFAFIGSHAGRPTMIHAFSRAGKVVEHGWDSFWLRRLVRVYELPGTAAVEDN
jgi:cell wall-associated NlpC family hydrolase